jgi:hypothetical protein
MKKHLSIKLVIAVIALSVYSYMVIKNGKSLSADQTTLSSQAPIESAPAGEPHSAPESSVN